MYITPFFVYNLIINGRGCFFMIIYKATNKNNQKVYIGLTIRELPVRIIEHKHKMKLYDYYFYKALRCHGFDSFTWEVIDKADNFDELKEKESHWISFYKSNINKFGYNSTEGGEGMIGFKHSEESKRKTSESLKKRGYAHWKGKKLSDKHRENIRKATTGKNNPSYGKRGELSPNFGRRHSEESKELMRKNIKRGSSHYNSKLNESKVKEIKIMLRDGIPKAEIARKMNVSRALIIHISQGKLWTHVKI
jgi:group I intron endonuclease